MDSNATDAIRLAYLRMLAALLHNACDTYYHGLPYYKGVLMSAITNAVFLAQTDGVPFNISRLAEHMGIARPTLKRHYLNALVEMGFVRIYQRDGQPDHLVEIEPAILTLSKRLANVGRAADVIIAAALEILAARGQDVVITTRTDQSRASA